LVLFFKKELLSLRLPSGALHQLTTLNSPEEVDGATLTRQKVSRQANAAYSTEKIHGAT
jgi:hypothetical protein